MIWSGTKTEDGMAGKNGAGGMSIPLRVAVLPFSKSPGASFRSLLGSFAAVASAEEAAVFPSPLLAECWVSLFWFEASPAFTCFIAPFAHFSLSAK